MIRFFRCRFPIAMGLIIFCFFLSHQTGKSLLSTTTAAHGNADEPGRLTGALQPDAYVIQEKRGEIICRSATPDEAGRMAMRDSNQPVQTITAAADSQQQQTGLKIILRGTSQLDGFPAAKNAFLKAAQTWESLIQNPITVVIDVDYGPSRFGQPFEPGTVGATQSQIISGATVYPTIRAALIARASSAEEAALYNLLPANTLPTDIGAATAASGPTPLFRALGLINAVADPAAEQQQYGAPPSIGFNSASNFDFDPTDGPNGVDADKIDFDSTAFHEIGHVLGFASNVGIKELDATLPNITSVWDFFRFRPGVNDTTFATAQRILTPGGDHVFFDGGPELPLSTARIDGVGGDGKQPQHWKDDLLLGQYIGTMIPTIGRATRNLTTINDLRAIDAMGFQLRTATTQASNELKLDDGTVEGGLRNDGLMAVNRLTPSSYPATLQTIRIQFRSFSGQADPTGKPIAVVFFTNPSGTTSPPANPQITRIETTVPGTSATSFFDFPVPNGPAITSGDFYVGFAAPTPNQGVGFPLDTNGLAQNRTFLSLNNGASFLPAGPPAGTTAANAVIRAVVTSATSLPSIEVRPSSIDFGNVNVNTAADRLLTVRNTGTAILNVTGITSSNPRFSVAAVSNSFIIAPGGQEAIPIRFSPAAAGNQTSLLILSSNDPARGSVTVQLIGTGSGPGANRVVRAVAASGAPGGTVAVPIELTSQGDENALGFSLTFDPSVLSNPQAALGADAAGSMLNTNLNQAAQGRAGIALARSSGQTFSAGARQIVVVTFSIAAGVTAPTTSIGFGDQPVPREVVNATANSLPATFTDGTIAIAQGFEADVAPRPNGNGSVSIADWVQIGRFVAGLDGISPGSEYQRADCAPRDSKGNGNLTVADWVQAGRYAASLDPTVAAGGSTGPGSASLLTRVRLAGRFAAADRTVRLLNSSRRDGSIAIELDTQGNENALGFSLQFDPSLAQFVSATLVNELSDATFQVNNLRVAEGFVGLALALPAGRTIPGGTQRLITLKFTSTATRNAGAAAIRFGDVPVAREVVDVNASPVTSAFDLAVPLHRDRNGRRLSAEQ